MEPYLGEIRPISFPYAPKGWAFCNGQLLPVNQNQALFALLGTTFGGNGQTTFGLPDLRSRIPVGTGQLAGGTNYTQGQVAGTESVALQPTQIPAHYHSYTGTLKAMLDAEEVTPNGQLPGKGSVAQYSGGPSNVGMGAPIPGTTASTGNNQGHENRPPVLGLNYIIALQGSFPSRP